MAAMSRAGHDPSGHDQAGHLVRMEWGPTGAAAVLADVMVVVDVLSFTTTVVIALERGMSVLPYAWKDDGAEAYADEREATLAVGRLEARSRSDQGRSAVSLSPAGMTTADLSGVSRIVLPSPNGSSIAFALAESGASVVAASLRNATAVAGHVGALIRSGATCAVVAAGERWPDETLRPAIEDLWGAGAVIAGLVDLGVTALSPEARVAEQSFRGVRHDLAGQLAACASGVELTAVGFAADVEVAGQLDASSVVPVLRGRTFVAAPEGPPGL